jgi:hypothetical protein
LNIIWALFFSNHWCKPGGGVNWYAVPTLKPVSCRRGSPFPTQLPLEGGGHEVQKGCRSVVFPGVLSSLLLVDLLSFSSFIVLVLIPAHVLVFANSSFAFGSLTILRLCQAGVEVAWRAHFKKIPGLEHTTLTHCVGGEFVAKRPLVSTQLVHLKELENEYI